MRLSLELLAVWLISDSVLNGATSWLQSSSPCSTCGGSSASIVLILLFSFATSVNGLRPMSINATECSVANGAAVAANIYAASGPSSTSHERSEVGCRWGLDAACGMHASRFCPFALGQKKAHKEACRAPGFASPLPRPRSLPCALHTSTRVQSTLDTHAPCVRASPAVHMLSCGNTRSHVKCLNGCSSHWPLADRRPARRWHIQRERALQCACHLHCARGTCVIHTLCLPSTTDVAPYAET